MKNGRSREGTAVFCLQGSGKTTTNLRNQRMETNLRNLELKRTAVAGNLMLKYKHSAGQNRRYGGTPTPYRRDFVLAVDHAQAGENEEIL